MKIYPKTPELIETQVGTYLTRSGETIPDNVSRTQIGRKVSALLDIDPRAVNMRVLSEISPKASVEDHVALANDYLRFLRQLSPEERKQIQAKADMIGDYERFAPLVDALECGSGKSKLLGSGHYSRVYELDLDGSLYALRMPKEDSIYEIDQHINASLKVGDLKHFEHLVAASYKDGVSVSELIPGIRMSDMSVQELSSISLGDIENLYVDMMVAEKRGVRFDKFGSNILYDPEAGFTMLDISTESSMLYGWANDSLLRNILFAYPEITFMPSCPLGGEARAEQVVRIFEDLARVIEKHNPEDTFVARIAYEVEILRDKIAHAGEGIAA